MTSRGRAPRVFVIVDLWQRQLLAGPFGTVDDLRAALRPLLRYDREPTVNPVCLEVQAGWLAPGDRRLEDYLTGLPESRCRTPEPVTLAPVAV